MSTTIGDVRTTDLPLLSACAVALLLDPPPVVDTGGLAAMPSMVLRVSGDPR